MLLIINEILPFQIPYIPNSIQSQLLGISGILVYSFVEFLLHTHLNVENMNMEKIRLKFSIGRVIMVVV